MQTTAWRCRSSKRRGLGPGLRFLVLSLAQFADADSRTQSSIDMQSKRPCQIDTAGRGSGPEDVANEVSYVVPIPLRLRRHSDSISTDGNMPRKAIQIEEPIEGHARLRESALGLRVFLRVTGPLFRRGHYSERTPFEEDSWLISQPRVSVWSGPPAVLWIRLRGKPWHLLISALRVFALVRA